VTPSADLFARRNRVRIALLVVLATINYMLAVAMAAAAVAIGLVLTILFNLDVLPDDAGTLKILAIGIGGIGLSLGALVGLVTVFGVGARNAILLLAHYEHLVENEGAEWNRETVLRGASERLVPILMTATVTALALAPLAVGMNEPGQEIEGPMAITVLGGLLTSTMLNLLVLPALAQRYSYRTKGERTRKGLFGRIVADGNAAE